MMARMTREQTTRARRRLIVTVAARCFAEKGFHQTSMRDLATAAGVSLGNVYNHFASKTDLIREIAKLEAEEIEAIRADLDMKADPADALDHFVTVYATSCAERETAFLIAEITAEGLRNPAIGREFLGNRNLLVATLAGFLGRIPPAAKAKPALEPAEQAQLALDLVEAVALRHAFEGKLPDDADLAMLRSGVRRLVGLGD